MTRQKTLEFAVIELTSTVNVLTALAERGGRRVDILVPVSGGKDSQACLKLAVNEFGSDRVLGLFCDTKFEHPKTYDHVEKLRQLYAVQITRVSGGDVLSESVKWGRFPGGGSRHCTDYLKIKQTRLFCTNLAKMQGGFEVWYGMRENESAERSRRYAGKIDDELYEPHEVMPTKYPKYLGAMGVRFRLPILQWSKGDVIEFLDGTENPLYAEGFDRVGCFPCLAGGDKSKEQAFRHDEFGQAQWVRVRFVSAKIGKSIWTSKAGKERNEGPGCMVCAI